MRMGVRRIVESQSLMAVPAGDLLYAGYRDCELAKEIGVPHISYPLERAEKISPCDSANFPQRRVQPLFSTGLFQRALYSTKSVFQLPICTVEKFW